jgi:hypothetical protein
MTRLLVVRVSSLPAAPRRRKRIIKQTPFFFNIFGRHRVPGVRSRGRLRRKRIWEKRFNRGDRKKRGTLLRLKATQVKEYRFADIYRGQ